MRNQNSRYARSNPFGAGFDAGGGVQSNVGAGGAGSYQPQGWSGTSQGYGGGKGSGYGMGKGGYGGMGGGMGNASMGGYSGYGSNYAPNYNQQYSVPQGYFNSVGQYNPLLAMGLSGMGMQPRPWQYNNPMPLFQSQNTFNQGQQPQQPQYQQQQSGSGLGAALPNFDQNGRITSIPYGVSWNQQENRWDYGGELRPENANNANNNWFNGAIPIEQYTGSAPWNTGGQPTGGGQPQTTGPGTGQQNTTGPFSMAGSASPSPAALNPWEGIGSMHAARGGAVEGGRDMQPDPFLIQKRR